MQSKRNNSMKKKQNNSRYTFSVTLISLSAALLTLAAAPARNRIEQKPAGAGMALQNAHRRAVVSESSAAPKGIKARKSARVEFSASRQRVGGREIAGFSARQARTAQEENLTPPAGLKPVEQEAWLAMARRQGASWRHRSWPAFIRRVTASRLLWKAKGCAWRCGPWAARM